MGAVLANAAAFGTELTLEDVETSDYCVDINAKYLCNLLEDSASYAVRITNIPVALEDRIIYARAYYVFEYEGREVIVYDDLQQANYSNKYDSNDGVLEW